VKMSGERLLIKFVKFIQALLPIMPTNTKRTGLTGGMLATSSQVAGITLMTVGKNNFGELKK
jgi:hypothetical protein